MKILAYKSKKWLHRMYWDVGLTTWQLAELAGCCQWTIRYWMDSHGIPRRDASESMILHYTTNRGEELRLELSRLAHKQWDDPMYRASRSGKNSHWWKGGHSANGSSYSRNFDREFKSYIRDLDGNCCVICESGDKLHIHHVDGDKKNTCADICVVLCHSCHSKITASGRKKSKYWQKVLESYVKGDA